MAQKKYEFNVIYNRAGSPNSRTPDQKLALEFTEFLVNNKLNGWNYKNGYYHDEHAKLGGGIFDEVNVIDMSPLTILLITPDFNFLTWNKYVSHIALKHDIDKDDADLIPISLDVKIDDLPTELGIKNCLFFNSTDNWKQGCEDNWRKLKKAFDERRQETHTGDTQVPAESCNVPNERIEVLYVRDVAQVEDAECPHVFISYQWDSQPILLQVRDFLKGKGFKVWMDVDNMSGSMMESMAKAVEKAAVVLICYSEKYKNSPNCKAEAEYVFNQRKEFIPLRLQQGYRADGWLGILLGSRLYFDMSTEASLPTQLPNLLKELQGRGKYSPSSDMLDQGESAKLNVQPTDARLNAQLIDALSEEKYKDLESSCLHSFEDSGITDVDKIADFSKNLLCFLHVNTQIRCLLCKYNSDMSDEIHHKPECNRPILNKSVSNTEETTLQSASCMPSVNQDTGAHAGSGDYTVDEQADGQLNVQFSPSHFNGDSCPRVSPSSISLITVIGSVSMDVGPDSGGQSPCSTTSGYSSKQTSPDEPQSAVINARGDILQTEAEKKRMQIWIFENLLKPILTEAVASLLSWR